jgi:signal transduction histidine kinase
MLVAHVVSAATWRTFTSKRNRAAFGVAGLISAAILIAGAYASLVSHPSVRPVDLLSEMRVFRIIYAVAALSTMAVILVGLIDIRRSRDAALETALAAARKDVETSAALLQMERDYAKAKELAARGARVISTASHDIRQPLAAMRAELDALKGDAPPAHTVDRLGTIVEHLGLLIDDMSREGRNNASVETYGVRAEDEASDDPQAEDAEGIPASLILETLERMFAGEARTKRVELKVVNSSVVFVASPAAILRIGANLVANALQHAGATRIVIGVKYASRGASLVVADDGRGFDEHLNEGGKFFVSGVKGQSSMGDGLGLSIVKELADKNGYALEVRSVVDRGSMILVYVPVSGKY